MASAKGVGEISIVAVHLLPKQRARVRFSYLAPFKPKFVRLRCYNRGVYMKIPKQYFRDRVVLMINATNAFLTLLTVVFLTSRLSDNHSNYIVQYRQTTEAGSFMAGSVWQLISFGLFALFVFLFNAFLSMRLYQVHRQLAAVVLGMATILLIFGLVVSNALLVLR